MDALTEPTTEDALQKSAQLCGFGTEDSKWFADIGAQEQVRKDEAFAATHPVTVVDGPNKPDVPATSMAVKITGNRWTSDKALIARGTMTNTSAVPVTVTKVVPADLMRIKILSQSPTVFRGTEVTLSEMRRLRPVRRSSSRWR